MPEVEISTVSIRLTPQVTPPTQVTILLKGFCSQPKNIKKNKAVKMAYQ